jgi:hypothetical protein
MVTPIGCPIVTSSNATQYRVQKNQREGALQSGLPRDPFCLLAHSSGSLTIFDARRSPSLFWRCRSPARLIL